jgi:glutamyl-tRNA reductase
VERQQHAAAVLGDLDLDGVRLVDVDRLRERFERREAAAAAELDRAHAIVIDEVRRFAIRRRSERLAPLITSLRARGEEVAVAELRRFRTELNGLTDDERAAVEALARGIVAKLLHDPVVRLKERAAPGTEAGYANVVAELFGIELPERPTS